MESNSVVSPTSSHNGDADADDDLPTASKVAGVIGTGFLSATPIGAVTAATPLRAFPASVLQTINIRHHVPAVLDLHAGNFSQWRRFFLTVVGMFGVRDHLTAELEDTAATVWAAVTSIFHDNQLSRAVYIDAEYHALVQGNLTIMRYCTRLKSFPDQLHDLRQRFTETQQLFNKLRGLGRQYHGAIPHITSRTPLPTFLQARSFLLLEEHHAEQAARQHTAHALVATRSPPQAPAPAPAPPPVSNASSLTGRGRGRRAATLARPQRSFPRASLRLPTRRCSSALHEAPTLGSAWCKPGE
ncbi:hypothetical protein D1007_39054 [Hordeum vulgare]|nr:hypothetical protein D1007_39054 [Hordeum vulgare]